MAAQEAKRAEAQSVVEDATARLEGAQEEHAARLACLLYTSSRHLDGRAPGEPPYTLIDYFPKDFLCIIDESHVTVPQLSLIHI